jgi:phosphosulfolactate phosphohydrolase-like enzyme
MGRDGDVEWCLQTDVSEAVPLLREGAFQASS